MKYKLAARSPRTIRYRLNPVQVLRDRLDQVERAYRRVEVSADLRADLAAAQARLAAVQEELTPSRPTFSIGLRNCSPE